MTTLECPTITTDQPVRLSRSSESASNATTVLRVAVASLDPIPVLMITVLSSRT